MIISVPRFLLNDRNGRAMAAAIDAAMAYLSERAQASAMQCVDVDAMPEWRLDEMAWEYALPWYDRGADTEAKRRTIKTMRQTLMTMGTARAVASVVSAFCGTAARMAEWPEYGGEPFHFRVISSSEILPAAERARLYAALDAAKNVRSFMDEMIWAWAANGTGRMAACGQIALRAQGTGVVN